MSRSRRTRDDYHTDERPASELLTDIHVYLMPSDLWRDHLNSAVSQIIEDTVSAGFIRVSPELSLSSIRKEIAKQVGFEIIPRNFVFIKSVGRCFTQLRPRQERELRAKHFAPPFAEVPELFVLDSTAATFSAASSSAANDEESDRQRLLELLKSKKRSAPRRRTPSPPDATTSSTSTRQPPARRNGYNNYPPPAQMPPRRRHSSPTPSPRSPSPETLPPLPTSEPPPRLRTVSVRRRRISPSPPPPVYQPPPPRDPFGDYDQTSRGPTPDTVHRPGYNLPEQQPEHVPIRPSSVDLAAERKELKRELLSLRGRRDELEKLREELIRKNKQLLSKNGNSKREARDLWKKRYYDEKKLTPAKEQNCAALRTDLDQQHRRITGQLETARDTGKRTAADRKLHDVAQMKIKATRLEQDIEGMHAKLENAKLRLTTEIKLRNQAEAELQTLRGELAQKKLNAHKSRSHAYHNVTQGNNNNNNSSSNNNNGLLSQQDTVTARSTTQQPQPQRRWM